VNNNSGTIKIIDAKGSCHANETALDWSKGGGGACVGNDTTDIMLKVGSLCIDVYEASVWSSLSGGIQYGASSDNYPCNDNSNDCKGVIYARSVAGVLPSARITWFQAQQACANAGKRLLTNAEWQMAAAGTPDVGDDGSTTCNVNSVITTVNTGSRFNCVSAWGIFDMMGNVWEWVAEWVPLATADPGWGNFSDDRMRLAGASETAGPGAIMRGSSFSDAGGVSGIFAVDAHMMPSDSDNVIGFRCGR
jgi:hypothetical protein